MINPLKFFLFYNLTYFHKINDQTSIGAGIQFPTVKDVNGWGLNAELRFYPTGKNMRGFYIAPNISYNSLHTNDEEVDPFSIGAIAGWQWFPGDQFAIGFGIGADYYSGSAKSNSGDTKSYNGFVPAVRFDIGFAW